MTDVDFLICNRKGDVLLTSDAGLVGKSVRVPEEIVETTFSNENGYEGAVPWASTSRRSSWWACP